MREASVMIVSEDVTVITANRYARKIVFLTCVTDTQVIVYLVADILLVKLAVNARLDFIGRTVQIRVRLIVKIVIVIESVGIVWHATGENLALSVTRIAPLVVTIKSVTNQQACANMVAGVRILGTYVA